jgi:hypothetical protein
MRVAGCQILIYYACCRLPKLQRGCKSTSPSLRSRSSLHFKKPAQQLCLRPPANGTQSVCSGRPFRSTRDVASMQWYRRTGKSVGVNRSIKHGLAYPRNISSARIFRGPRVGSFALHGTQVVCSGGRCWFTGDAAHLMMANVRSMSEHAWIVLEGPCM